MDLKRKLTFEEVWAIYEEEMAKRDNSDYEVVREQITKLNEAYDLFTDIAKKCNGRVEITELIPKEIHCGITAYFTLFHVYGKDIERLCEAMRNFSAISIDSLNDGTVCISVTIPNVFRKKKD